MKIKTGIFGGSFNPIHIGHLALANYLCEYAGLEELWFMVSPQNPLKNEDGLMPDGFRLRLVEAAIAGYPKFRASDFEFSLPRPSYTSNTFDLLKGKFPEREFFLIVGSDNWLLFPKWKEYEKLISENQIIIYPRPGADIDKHSLPQKVRLVEAPLMDVSSTFIRQAIKEKRDIRYFLHPETYKLLQVNVDL